MFDFALRAATNGLQHRPLAALQRPSARLDPTWPWLLPATAFVWLAIVGDTLIADAFYELEGHQWRWRHSPFLADDLHVVGRMVAITCWLLIAGALLASWSRGIRNATWQREVVYVLVSVLLSTLVVAWIKSWSNVDCPWDLSRYGGDRPLLDLWQARPTELPRGRCFPAGQASAGYAWVALYFAARRHGRGWRAIGLATGLGAGAVLGVAQQLRGAHFASHDVAAAVVCWLVASVLARWLLHSGVDASPWSTAGAPR